MTNEKAYDGDYHKKEENHYDVHDDHDECDYDAYLIFVTNPTNIFV